MNSCWSTSPSSTSGRDESRRPRRSCAGTTRRGGVVQPSDFVGLAEETGLIVPIGRFVMREACRQAAQWTGIAPGLRIFVNLSTRQLSDPDLVRTVCDAVENAGLDPANLLLEVTETAMMRDIEEARATLLALKEHGVQIAIDDFGTGFSSLSYLRQLPIDVLKIAKPIIDTINDSPENAAFVKGIIELGHVIGLKVVAEGVEEATQFRSLVDMGCDFVQGYYYAPSLKPAEITEILQLAARGTRRLRELSVTRVDRGTPRVGSRRLHPRAASARARTATSCPPRGTRAG